MNKVETVTVLSLLGLCTMEDVRENKLHIMILGAFAIAGLCIHMMFRTLPIEDVLAGMTVGMVLLFLSYMTKEKIGRGDGFLLMVTGIYLGFWQNLMLLWGAAFLAGIFGLIMVVICKKGKDTEIPFAPFVLLAYIIILFAEKL